jgi:hypothetical protein
MFFTRLSQLKRIRVLVNLKWRSQKWKERELKFALAPLPFNVMKNNDEGNGQSKRSEARIATPRSVRYSEKIRAAPFSSLGGAAR